MQARIGVAEASGQRASGEQVGLLYPIADKTSPEFAIFRLQDIVPQRLLHRSSNGKLSKQGGRTVRCFLLKTEPFIPAHDSASGAVAINVNAIFWHVSYTFWKGQKCNY